MGVQKKIIAKLFAGFCNRLRAITSSRILSECLGRELFIMWPVDKYCRCHWYDLFETKLPFVDKVSLQNPNVR